MPAPIPTLIIDDRESDADFLRAQLRQLAPDHTFAITWESDPRQALAKLPGTALVLLDYQMPVMNGLDLLRLIRERDAKLPVIMLTGQGNEAVAVEAMKRGAHDYLKKDQLTLPDLARAVMTSLERYRLETELAARQEALEVDRRLARELQQAFLPENLPHFAPDQRPDALGLRVAHRYTPTLAIGGDFFDVLPVDDHTAGIFLAGVAGHGMPAALVTAVLRTLLEEHRDEAGDADAFLGRINTGLHRILRQVSAPVFASAFYLKLDMREQRGAFASASHPTQLHLRRRSGEVSRLLDISKSGPLLGQEKNAAFPAHGFSIESDDIFVLFTDGLTGVCNAAGEPFGLPRLEAAAKRLLKAAPEALTDGLLKAASDHAGTTVFTEDVCLVAVEAAAAARR